MGLSQVPVLQVVFNGFKEEYRAFIKYYGPFKVLQKVGPVAYKLELPLDSKIHLIFHGSNLK